MKAIYARHPIEDERQALQAGLKSNSALTVRRCQMILLSADNRLRVDHMPVMELLFEEAHQLFRKRNELSLDIYKSALRAIKNAYAELLKMDTNSCHARRPQTCYKKYYGVDALLAFWESASPLDDGGK